MIRYSASTSKVSAIAAWIVLVSAWLAVSPGASAQGNPKELVIAMPANINTLDPHQTATVETDLSVISHLYQPLVIRGADMKLKPVVAKSWKAVNDTTWQFELTPGITSPSITCHCKGL